MNRPGRACVESTSLMGHDVGRGAIGPWLVVRVTLRARGGRTDIDGAGRNVCDE